MGGVAGGRYKAVKRDGVWIVRAPDGRAVTTYGSENGDHKKARHEADRLNEKLRAVDEK